MKNKHLWPLLYGLALTAFSACVLLEAFVIPRSYSAATENAPSPAIAASSEAGSGGSTEGNTEKNSGAAESAAVITDGSYNDGNYAIQITQYRAFDTDLCVADITLIGVDGSFFIVREGDVTAEKLLDAGAQQALSFNPGLVRTRSLSAFRHVLSYA